MGIEKTKVVGDAPGIFTPDEMQQLLNAAQEHVPDVLGFLAIGAFAGLRMAEIERLVWSDVDVEGGIYPCRSEESQERTA